MSRRATFIAGMVLVTAIGVTEKLSVFLVAAAVFMATVIHDEWPSRAH